MKLSDPDNVQRRRFLGQAAATLGASLFAPVLPAFAAKEELRLGYLPITDAAPLLIAHSLGYFLEEGLVVPRPVMVRSWKVLAESFMAGKFDLTHMLFPIPVWMRFKQKMPVKVLGWDHTNGSAITVHGDSDIRGFADLGGKQIAVPSWYSTHNLVLQIGLRARGLTPVIKPQNSPLKPNEVNLFILPPPEMPPALLGRKIDGFIVAEPFNALAEMKLRARIMRFTGDVWKNHPCCVLVAREELTRRRPTFVQKAVNAVVRAQLWCEQNREQAAHILSRDGEGYLPVKAKVLKRVFTGYDLKEYTTGPLPRAIMHPEWDIQRIGFQPYPFPSATRFVLEQMGKTLVEGDNSFLKNIDSARAAGELVDDSFVLKAMDSNREYGRFFPSDVAQPLSREEIIEID
jgi:NitT/TauT family transport system substrate-binding protein